MAPSLLRRQIAEVGRKRKSPSGAQIIDGTGLFVSPGIIDCHSHIAWTAA